MGAIFKRIFDFISVLIGGLIISPLLIYVAYRIKKDSPGPAIYDGERIGKDGKLFKCYKFRSMIQDSEWMLEEYLANNPEEKEQWDQYKKLDHDPRVTPFGDKIRRLSIDELPQLWNVLMGDMSLVGPRPYLPREIDDMGEYYKNIIKVKPGMTKTPKTITEEKLAAQALHIMESNIPKPITVLPVVDGEMHVIGILHLTDLTRNGIL